MGGISISSIDRKGKTAAAPVIKLESSVLFLNEHLSSLPFASRRSAAADEGVPAGATLRGSVNLDLPQARCVKSITVELVGELKAVYPSGDSEQLETLRHEVDLLYSHSPFLPAGPTSCVQPLCLQGYKLTRFSTSNPLDRGPPLFGPQTGVCNTARIRHAAVFLVSLWHAEVQPASDRGRALGQDKQIEGSRGHHHLRWRLSISRSPPGRHL